MKIKKVILTAWLLAVLLLASASCSPCLAAPEKTGQNYKQIPIGQWERLAYNINLYEANLILVQEKLTEQEMLSKELMSLLINANVALDEAKKEMQSAKSSLLNAEQALTKLSESYSLLKIQMEAERKEAAKREKEAYRKGWVNGFCFGAVGATIGALYNGIK